LCEWNSNTYGHLKSKIKMTKSRVKAIKNKSEVESLTSDESDKLSCFQSKLWVVDRIYKIIVKIM
jgi:hypothetical protein